MKSCVVYYFSGTGNTESVADMIKQELLKQQCSVDLIKIEDILKGKVKMSLEKYDLVGLGSFIKQQGRKFPLCVMKY